jgi:hypothetical protein
METAAGAEEGEGLQKEQTGIFQALLSEGGGVSKCQASTPLVHNKRLLKT